MQTYIVVVQYKNAKIMFFNFSCLHGNGNTLRHFLYVGDAVEAYDIILHRGIPGEIYNVGSEYSVSVLELTKFLIFKVWLCYYWLNKCSICMAHI